LPNNIVTLVTIDKFDPNLVLDNINKLKPYRFIENRTLQPILVKPSDLATNEPIQIEIPKPPPVKNEDFEPIDFELVNNNLTLDNVAGVDVPLHYHGDVLVQSNDVLVCNDQNDIFAEERINVYTLEVYNLKSHVYL
jgi:hypothetical protein